MLKNIDDDVEKGDGDVISGYGFFNIHTLYWSDYLCNFKNIDGDVVKSDVSSRYGFIDSYN